jgi:hypothetical protein
MSVFKVELFCDKRRLGDIYEAVAGYALAPGPTARPVSGAEVNGSGEVAPRRGGGDIVGLFREWVKKNKLTLISAGEVRQFLKEAGRNPSTYSHVLTKLRDARLVVLKPGGKGNKTRYTVTLS